MLLLFYGRSGGDPGRLSFLGGERLGEGRVGLRTLVWMKVMERYVSVWFLKKEKCFLISFYFIHVFRLYVLTLFTGLTMWDAQKIKALASAERELGNETARKLSVMGALMLYFDYVNLFFSLLRVMGRRK